MAVLGLSLGLGIFISGCATQPRAISELSGYASREPLNLSNAKAAVIAYVDSGDYQHDLNFVAIQARAWITRRAENRKPGERLAVVFDVDETVLSNLPHMLSQDFGYTPEAWAQWVYRGAAPALPAMFDVYQLARGKNVAVLFLTGRREPSERAGTEKNLRHAGMDDYAALVFSPAAAPRGQTTLERKTAQRAAWEAEGWTIIATIGDQDSDLGAHAERSFKLPNPFYRIP